MRVLVVLSPSPGLLGDPHRALVTRLHRRNRYVLLQMNSRGLYYSEDGAARCWAIAPGTLSDTVCAVVRGRRLDEVIDLGQLAGVFGSCTISAAEAAWQGATIFDLKPRWLQIDC